MTSLANASNNRSGDKERPQLPHPKEAQKATARQDPKATIQYGPISRRLNSVATPISFDKFVGLHSQQAHKLKRDLNLVDNSNSAKQKTLEKLKKELARVKEITERTKKLQAISAQYDKELLGAERKKNKPTHTIEERYLLDIQTPASIDGGRKLTWTRRPASAIAARVRDAKSNCRSVMEQKKMQNRQKSAVPGSRGASHERGSLEEDDAEQEPRFMRQTQCHIYKSARKQGKSDSELSFDANILDEKVNIDQGIAINDYKPSQLLEKKIRLICQIKESRIKYLRELYQVDQYRHMLRRMEAGYKEESSILRELDPYFNFQDKIKGTLTDIGTGKEQRQKIFEQKIRQLRYQLSEKQNIMQQELRFKCRELAVLQRYNKKKSKQRTPRDRENLSDSQSVSGSTVYGKSRARDSSRYDDKQSQFTPVSRRKDANGQDKDTQRDDVSKIDDEKDDQHQAAEEVQKTAEFEINLDNAVELHELIQSCTIMKKMYMCYKQVERGDGEEESVSTIHEIRGQIKEMEQKRRDFKEQTLRIQGILNSKPSKTNKVAFMLTSAKAHISRKLSEQNQELRKSMNNVDTQVLNAQTEKQARQAKLQEAQEQAHQVCEDIKNHLEQLMTRPEWLTTMEGRFMQGDTDLMLHELNEDILFKQEKSMLQKGGSSFVDDENAHALGAMFYDDIWDNSSLKVRNGKELHRYSKPKKQTFKQKNENAIKEIRMNIERIRNEESSPLRRSKTIGESLPKRHSRERGSRPASPRDSQQLDKLREELQERLKMQERIEQEEEKLNGFELLKEIVQHREIIIQIYNERLAKDSILSMEHVELNDNKVKKRQEQEELRKELEAYREAERVNRELRIDHLSYQEREFLNNNENTITDEVERVKFQERQLLRKALSKYEHVDGIMKLVQRDEETADDYRKRQAWMAKAFFIHDKTEDACLRAQRLRAVKAAGEREMQLDQYLLKQEQIKDYNIEQMFQNHREFKFLTGAVRAIHDRIRLQCKESTNAFTFRIHCILDVAKIKCPNDDLRTIIKRHKKYWPYQSLNYNRSDKDGQSKGGGQEDAALQSLLGMESTKRLTIAQKRKLEAAKKKLQQERQKVFEAPQELDNKEIIGNVLKQLIETRLNFVHQKFILSFLVFQIKELRVELKIKDEENNSEIISQTSNSQFQFNHHFQGASSGRREELTGSQFNTFKDFEREYKVVMDVNLQNYRNITVQQNSAENDGGVDDPEGQKAQEEQMILQNLVQLEERYHKESRENHHEDERRRHLEKLEALKPKKSHFVQVNDRLTQRLGGGHEVNDQVNRDKIRYGKLMSYSLQDTDFIQNFMVEARKYQKSELLQIPELDAEERDPKKAMESLLKQTMCHQLKRVDNKEEVRTRQEIIREKLIQNMKPTLRFDLKGERRDPKRSANNQLQKRTRSTNTRNSLSHKTMRDTMQHKNYQSAAQLRPNQKQLQSDQQPREKFRIRKIQGKKQSDAEPRTSYGRIEHVLSKKYDEMQKSTKDHKVGDEKKMSMTSKKLNADLYTPGKSSSILKKAKGSVSIPETSAPGAVNKLVIPTLNLKQKELLKPLNEAEIEKGLMASSVNSPGRFLATITDEEEDTIASKQKTSDQLLVRAKGHASKEWYLAASDEEYSIPGDHDQRTVTNTINTSTHQAMHPLLSTRNIGIRGMNLEQTQTNAFFTDRNRPTSATSMNQLKFNRPLKVQEIEPAYQTSANFFDQDHDAQTMKSYHSQHSLVGVQHLKKNSEVPISKIKIKKIKLPKLKKNKELNNMIKDL